MMNRADLERLLVEAHPLWEKSEEGQEVTDWLERNDIGEEVWESLGASIWVIAGENMLESIRANDPARAIEGIIAGFQLAFFVGFESAKEYAPRSDMSQISE